MPASPSGDAAGVAAVALAEAAAAAAVAVGEAAAALGATEGKLAYTLTYKMIGSDEAPLVFPLLALSVGAIIEGMVTYVASDAAATALGLPPVVFPDPAVPPSSPVSCPSH